MTKTELTELLATPDAFKAWLNGKEVSAHVGVRLNAESCPLACFLIEETKAPSVCVDPEDIAVGRTSISTPDWADRFIEHVDSYKKPNITASMARTALRRALK